MSVITSVPIPTLGPLGYVAPAAAQVLAGVRADLQLAFGGRLNPAPQTPQGQLAASFTAIIDDFNALFLQYTNLVNPPTSSGRMQDAIGYLYFLTRNPAQPTVVQANCVGLAGVVIPVGATAQATDGNLYFCTQTGTIPPSGTTSLPFACAITGPIVCPENSLNTIYTAIFGWDSINNPEAGVAGTVVEGPAAFEERRKASVALNGIGSLPSVTGAVLSVPGVLDAYTTENVTDDPVTVGGVTLGGHSLYVCVAGGAAIDVATAIWTKKGNGCNYNGGTTVTVYDTTYTNPQPSYPVSFQTAIDQPTLFAVTLKNSSSVPSNALTQIQAAMLLAFAGVNPAVPRARIGGLILASLYYGVVAQLGSWAQIIQIQIGSCTPSAADAVFTGSISGTTLTVSALASGTIAIGQSIFDTTGIIVPGTMITAGSGSSWTVSNSQTVSGETITAAVADLNDVQMQINEAPVLSAVNITLTLV